MTTLTLSDLNKLHDILGKMEICMFNKIYDITVFNSEFFDNMVKKFAIIDTEYEGKLRIEHSLLECDKTYGYIKELFFSLMCFHDESILTYKPLVKLINDLDYQITRMILIINDDNEFCRAQ
jgi:hypothetical protein